MVFHQTAKKSLLPSDQCDLHVCKMKLAIFLLTGLRIRANTKPKARHNARPKEGPQSALGSPVHANQLVRSLLPD